MDILALILAIGLGFGAACWFTGRALDKSNNIGDSTGTRFTYKATVHFTVQKDRMSGSDRDTFSTRYVRRLKTASPDLSGNAPVRRLTEKERAEYRWEPEVVTSDTELKGERSPMQGL